MPDLIPADDNAAKREREAAEDAASMLEQIREVYEALPAHTLAFVFTKPEPAKNQDGSTTLNYYVSITTPPTQPSNPS